MDMLFDTILLVGSVFVLVIALYAFARSIGGGEGAIVGFRRMWSVTWKNMP